MKRFLVRTIYNLNFGIPQVLRVSSNNYNLTKIKTALYARREGKLDTERTNRSERIRLEITEYP